MNSNHQEDMNDAMDQDEYYDRPPALSIPISSLQSNSNLNSLPSIKHLFSDSLPPLSRTNEASNYWRMNDNLG